METNAQDVQGADDKAAETTVETEVEAKVEDGSESPTDGKDPAAEGLKSRIDELTKHRRAAERRAMESEARSQALARELESARAPKEQVQTGKLKTLADFEFDEQKYSTYLYESAGERAVTLAEQKLRDAQNDNERKAKFQSYVDKEAKFAETVEDYYEITRKNDLPLTRAVFEGIQELDDGPEVLLHLGKNADLLHKLASLPPRALDRELGRLSAKLEYERERVAAAKKLVSKAPPPAAKVDGSGAIKNTDTTSSASDKLTDDEWVKAEQKRLAKLRKVS